MLRIAEKETGQGQWPGSVERWVNVRAIGDKAAAVSLREKHSKEDSQEFMNSLLSLKG